MSVIEACIYTEALCRITKVSKSFTNRFAGLAYKMGRHSNAFAHHVFKSQHHFAGIYLKYFSYKTFICIGMPGFIAGNYTAYLRELITTMLFCKCSRATVRNISGQFLERSVYKILVRVFGTSVYPYHRQLNAGCLFPSAAY